MNHIVQLPEPEYGVMAKVSIDFTSKELISNAIVSIETSPSVSLNFKVSPHAKAYGSVSSELSGGLSAKSRQKEKLHQDIAYDLYQRYAILQKKTLINPVACLAESMSQLMMPDAGMAEYIKGTPTVRIEYINSLYKSVVLATIKILTLDKLTQLTGHPHKEDTTIAIERVRNSIRIASKAYTALAGDHALNVFLAKHLPLRAHTPVNEEQAEKEKTRPEGTEAA